MNINALAAILGKYLFAFFSLLFAALGLTAVVSFRKARREENRAKRAEIELQVKELEEKNANESLDESIKKLDSELDADKRDS